MIAALLIALFAVSALGVVVGTCCCGGDATNHCFQIWTVTYSCETHSFGARTAGAKVCLIAATSLAWVRIAKDATTCTYQRYVDMGTTCTVDGDCSGLANTAAPDFPPTPKDCCQACCKYHGFPCCMSDFSSWVGVMPSLTYIGPPSPDEEALVDWYNSSYAGTTVTFPFVFCGKWELISPDGAYTFVVGKGDAGGGLYSYSNDGVSFGISGPGGGLDFDTDSTQNCCSVSGGTWVPRQPLLVTVSGSVNFQLVDNHCCGDVVVGVFTCFTEDGDCDGICNPLP